MIAILITITILLVALTLFMGAAIAHIIRIQQELEALAKVNKEQDETMARAIVYMGNVGTQVELTQQHIKQLETKTTQSWGSSKGEA